MRCLAEAHPYADNLPSGEPDKSQLDDSRSVLRVAHLSAGNHVAWPQAGPATHPRRM